MNVPISGTDLFLQKSEAEANEGAYSSSMTRIGKIKEKRYKCSKCPSAFEKREQFKLHLGLHGSNQQYACASCDYAVSNQANLLQHEKKHKSIKSFEDDVNILKTPRTLLQCINVCFSDWRGRCIPVTAGKRYGCKETVLVLNVPVHQRAARRGRQPPEASF